MNRIAITLITLTAGFAGPLCIAQTATSPGVADATIWEKGVPPAPGGRADFGDHVLSISRRSSNGKAEVHKTKSDVMVVQSGSATLVTGGEVVDPVSTGPDEIQGASIKGGTTRTVTVGDVIEVPAGVPHQFFLTPGTQITYLLVKVNRTSNPATIPTPRPAP